MFIYMMIIIYQDAIKLLENCHSTEWALLSPGRLVNPLNLERELAVTYADGIDVPPHS